MRPCTSRSQRASQRRRPLVAISRAAISPTTSHNARLPPIASNNCGQVVSDDNGARTCVEVSARVKANNSGRRPNMRGGTLTAGRQRGSAPARAIGILLGIGVGGERPSHLRQGSATVACRLSAHATLGRAMHSTIGQLDRPAPKRGSSDFGGLRTRVLASACVCAGRGVDEDGLLGLVYMRV